MEDNQYLSVTAVNKYLKHIIEQDVHLQDIYIKGEISNITIHGSGHIYFSLKDDNSIIKAIMFKFNASKLVFTPTDGMKVLVKGRISVYEASGAYQVYVNEMSEDGLGDLHIAYEQLKKKLATEGLFDQVHKKPIPLMPKKVGVITAPTGAAVRDIISTIKRRWPLSEIYLFPALVQGENAKDDVVKKIKQAAHFDLDTLIIGRGGGSIEDLWAFNEEIVVRAIFESDIPIISAVGHETDTTIADYVADLRAATPTAAAEIAVPYNVDVVKHIKQLQTRSTEAYLNKLKLLMLQVQKLKNSFVLKNVGAIYEPKFEKLNNLVDKMNKIINNKVEVLTINIERLKNSYVLKNPSNIYELKFNQLNNLVDKVSKSYHNILEINLLKVDKVIEKLIILNPLQTLHRGYAIVKMNNQVISSINNLRINDRIDINLKDGLIKASVIEKGKNNE